jgi:hypothetical protein
MRFIAAQKDHVDAIRLLVGYGVDVSTAANDGTIPMLVAAQTGYKSVINYKMLYKLEADMKRDLKLSVTELAQNHSKAAQLIKTIIKKPTTESC